MRELDAVGLAQALRRGALSQDEALAACRARIAARNPALNAVIELYDDPAPVSPQASGPLAGVPMLRKDLDCVEAGRLCENGSRLCAGVTAADDSLLMTRLREAGLRVIGRSAVAEFGYASGTDTAAFGLTRNPHDPTRSAGGSSGGAAAAVAARMVPLAHGSDTGGSVRTPASWTGIVGFKPGRARISFGAAAGLPMMGMTSDGVLTRSVRDAAAFLDAVSGPAPADPVRVPAAATPFLDAARRPPESLRIGVLEALFPGQRVAPEIRARLAAVADALQGIGWETEPCRLDLPWAAFMAHINDAWCAHLSADILRHEAATGRDAATLLQPVVARCHAHGLTVPATRLIEVEAHMTGLRALISGVAARFDLLLCPTSTAAAPEHAALDPRAFGGGPLDWAARSFDYEAFAVIFNVTGQPAISLPLGMTEDGLPFGLQFVAPQLEEARLLAAAARVEAELGFTPLP